MAKRSTAQLSRRLLRSRLLPSMFVGLSLALGSVACTKAPQKPPTSALKQAKKEDRPTSQDELERRHQAPPPAYGNKVVMAQEENGPTGSF